MELGARARTTIADVARGAGVSRGAVSLALNGRPGVADETRTRILRTATELGFRPHPGARALAGARAGALGLVVARDAELLGSDPFFAHFLAGVESVLAEEGHALLLQVVGDDPAVEERAYRRLAEDGRVDGAFLLDLRSDDPRPEILARLGLPSVAVGARPHEPSGTGSWPDDGIAIAALVEHLVALGHRRIALVGGTPGYVHAIARREAAVRALAAHGLAPAGDIRGGFTAEGGARATEELLAAAEPPTAILYANDLMAIGGLAAARRAGVAVPEALSIVGFDDVPLAAYLAPPLTTVRQDARGWGATAAATLLRELEVSDRPIPPVPPPLPVFRQSTAPPAREEIR
jgi:DNA-binding LacI/PurR family transcriptional regulator